MSGTVVSTKQSLERLLKTWSGLSPQIRAMLPGVLKYLVGAIILVNFRGWPFAWHARIYLLAWAVRLRYLFRRCTLLLKPRATRKKLEAEWLEKLSPVGANPLTWTTSYTTWCGPDDSDFNMHMSNSSYPKNLDMARFNGSLGLNPTLYRCGGWVALGGTHFKYLREIPMLSLYEMRTSIAAWDQKWIYVITRFVTKPKGGKKSGNKPRPTPDAVPTPPTTDAPIGNLHTPADPKLVQDATAADSPLKRLLAAAEQLDEEDGATLHCIAISECCYKINRITIPPALVMAAEGFSAPPQISSSKAGGIKFEPYTHTNPPPHWSSVRALRPTNDLRKLQAFFKGGWREVPEGQRWWEQAFAGIEEKRKLNLELIKGVHDGMEAAKYMRPV